MKYLVTGVAGFIGFHLTKMLLEKGETVVGSEHFNLQTIGLRLFSVYGTFGRPDMAYRYTGSQKLSFSAFRRNRNDVC